MPLRAVLLVASLVAAHCAVAQSYPSKPVRVIVGFPAGGPSDIPARGLGQHIAQKLGQPFVIEHRLGANGILSMEACTRAAPDGYTLCTANNGQMSINPIVYPKLSYDPQRDFAPIVNFGVLESVLVAHPSVPAQSLKELFELAKAKPDSITWGSNGHGSSSHMYVEWFRVHGIPIVHVPYKGAAPALDATVGGLISVTLNAVGRTAPLVKAGKLRALATNGNRPSRLFPDLPSFKDENIIVMAPFGGLFAPAGTPAAVVQLLNREANAMLADAKLVEQFIIAPGMTPVGGTPEEFAVQLREDRALYEKVLKTTGIKIE